MQMMQAAYFSYSSLIRRPHSLSSLWNFAVKLTIEETRVYIGLLSGESCMILPSTVFDWSTRVTDGRTDGRATAYSALRRYSIYAVAR